MNRLVIKRDRLPSNLPLSWTLIWMLAIRAYGIEGAPLGVGWCFVGILWLVAIVYLSIEVPKDPFERLGPESNGKH